jgi:clan AA aspartic protease
MGLTHVSVTIKNPKTDEYFESRFLVDTGAMDSLVPASDLTKIGIQPVGKKTYELADATRIEFDYGLAVISFMNETTAGQILFGPENAEPILGVIALESAGMVVDPINLTLKRLPAIYLK